MNPYRAQKKDNPAANQPSHGSQSTFQDTRGNWGLHSEPPFPPTTQRRWGSNNPYSRIVNASKAQEGLPRQSASFTDHGHNFR